MAIEVEIKLKIEDSGELIKKLKDQHFTAGKTVWESDLHFTSEHRNMKACDEALRVRCVEEKDTGKQAAYLTYKGKNLDTCSMTRKEVELEISDGETGVELLKSIGFYPTTPVEKLRQYFHREQMTACVDQVTGLGDFLELEIIVEDETKRAAALSEIETLLVKLGYTMQDTTRTSYLSMLEEAFPCGNTEVSV